MSLSVAQRQAIAARNNALFDAFHSIVAVQFRDLSCGVRIPEERKWFELEHEHVLSMSEQRRALRASKRLLAWKRDGEAYAKGELAKIEHKAKEDKAKADKTEVAKPERDFAYGSNSFDDLERFD